MHYVDSTTNCAKGHEALIILKNSADRIQLQGSSECPRPKKVFHNTHMHTHTPYFITLTSPSNYHQTRSWLWLCCNVIQSHEMQKSHERLEAKAGRVTDKERSGVNTQ